MKVSDSGSRRSQFAGNESELLGKRAIAARQAAFTLLKDAVPQNGMNAFDEVLHLLYPLGPRAL
jgi:hypothetical protein